MMFPKAPDDTLISDGSTLDRSFENDKVEIVLKLLGST